MTRRKIAEFKQAPGHSDRVARVYRDAEWNEWVVRFDEWWCGLPEADYFTNDKQDALDTASSWCKTPVDLVAA
jgi:hypothetical protein